jgi:hypothetical protein
MSLPINFNGGEIVLIRGEILVFGFPLQYGNTAKSPVL